MVDIYFDICNQPRMFEWNYMHHWGLEYACIDMDGVLCEDPKMIENIDSKNYIRFLKNAQPKFLPTKRIKYIVSGRLEKYRKETEEWLKKYNIEYENLILLDCNNHKERLTMDVSKFKATIYKNSNCFLFIESNLEQAVNICKISNKQVFCTENRRLINPDNIEYYTRIILNDWTIAGKRVIKKLLNKI